jgi:hypothetical protein
VSVRYGMLRGGRGTRTLTSQQVHLTRRQTACVELGGVRWHQTGCNSVYNWNPRIPGNQTSSSFLTREKHPVRPHVSTLMVKPQALLQVGTNAFPTWAHV